MSEPSNEIEFSMAVLCYRGGTDIIPFVENFHKIMTMFRFPWEIVLVGNYWPGTEDSTPEIVKQLATRLPNVRYIAEEKQGDMGWDARSGLDACRGKYIGFIDGDGQFPVEAVFSCFAKIKSDDYDLVKTYRVQRGDSFYRKIISLAYNRLFCTLFPDYRGRGDVNSKPKIMKREVYERMDLRSDDWFFDAEIMLECLALKLRVYEIPVIFEPLSKRKSFVKPGAIFEFVKHLIAYRLGKRHHRNPSIR